MTTGTFIPSFSFTLMKKCPCRLLKEGSSSPKFRREPLTACPVLRRRVEGSVLALSHLHLSALLSDTPLRLLRQPGYYLGQRFDAGLQGLLMSQIVILHDYPHLRTFSRGHARVVCFQMAG